MKTAIVFELIPEDYKLYVVDGDYKHLHGIVINCSPEGDEHLEKELNELIYKAEEGEKHKPVTREEFRDAIKDGAEFIVAGLYL